MVSLSLVPTTHNHPPVSVHSFTCCPANWEILISCQNTNQGLVNLALTNALEDSSSEDEDDDFYWHAVDNIIYDP